MRAATPMRSRASLALRCAAAATILETRTKRARTYVHQDALRAQDQQRQSPVPRR